MSVQLVVLFLLLSKLSLAIANAYYNIMRDGKCCPL